MNVCAQHALHLPEERPHSASGSHNERMLDGYRLRRHQQEEEQLAPAEDEEEEEEEESEYETDSEEEGFGRALLKPVFVPKVRTCELTLQLFPAGHKATVSRLWQVPIS